jgi:hypothetical protein
MLSIVVSWYQNNQVPLLVYVQTFFDYDKNTIKGVTQLSGHFLKMHF